MQPSYMASKGDQSLYMKERQVHVYTTCMWIYILDLFKQIFHYIFQATPCYTM